METLIIFAGFGFATGLIGRGKGSSFVLWFIIGAVLPFLGLFAVILYRAEKTEPERDCPRCGKRQKLYVQVCTRCGIDLYLPETEQALAEAGEGAAIWGHRRPPARPPADRSRP
ncbi:MAG: hypothetical protein ACR2NA_06450 [Solirubrobacterales bacterium]